MSATGPGATSTTVPGPASTSSDHVEAPRHSPATARQTHRPASCSTRHGARHHQRNPTRHEPVAPATPQSLQEILGGDVRQIMDSLAQTPSSGRFEFSMSWKLRLMATALESPAQIHRDHTAGAKLLGETLQDVAASQKA